MAGAGIFIGSRTRTRPDGHRRHQIASNTRSNGLAWRLPMLGVGVEFGTPLDEVAHIIRLALTPVFFLLSIAALLNVFSARLALVGDRVEQVTKVLETADKDHAAALR